MSGGPEIRKVDLFCSAGGMSVPKNPPRYGRAQRLFKAFIARTTSLKFAHDCQCNYFVSVDIEKFSEV